MRPDPVLRAVREELRELHRLYQQGVLWLSRELGLEPYILRLLDWLQKRLAR